MEKRNKCFIYRNDLKFNNQLDIEATEFDTPSTKSLYLDYKNKPKIELRIKDSEMESHRYLDLSKLNIDDELFKKMLKLKRIINILKKIEFLDLSVNNLNFKPDLSEYPNIECLNLSFNNISGNITDNILKELCCESNKITNIKSNSIIRLNASDNLVELIDVPNIQILLINNNKIEHIDSYINLEYLECVQNKIININNMIKLQELYISDNMIQNIESMPNLLILNCKNNPVQKIKYFEKLNMLITSTNKISSKYSILNLSKIKNDYLINFKV